MGIAVISGNLPLLRPLFERFFRNKGQTTSPTGDSYPLRSTNQSYTAHSAQGDFERIDEGAVSTSESLVDAVSIQNDAIKVTTYYSVETSEN